MLLTFDVVSFWVFQFFLISFLCAFIIFTERSFLSISLLLLGFVKCKWGFVKSTKGLGNVTRDLGKMQEILLRMKDVLEIVQVFQILVVWRTGVFCFCFWGVFLFLFFFFYVLNGVYVFFLLQLLSIYQFTDCNNRI